MKAKEMNMNIVTSDPDIVTHIAEMTSEKLDDIMTDIETPAAHALLLTLEKAEPEAMYEILRLLFMISGNSTMTDCLDILAIIAKNESKVYGRFKREFMDADEMDYWKEDIWLDSLMEEGGADVRS